MKGDARLTGKSGKEYFFQSVDINNNCGPVDFFLYAKLYEDSTGRKEWELTTIDKANTKLCLQAEPPVDKGSIFEDLHEDENYKIKIDYVGD